ncbi:MAG: redoxin domain-containing protein [Bacteroidales bacterium]
MKKILCPIITLFILCNTAFAKEGSQIIVRADSKNLYNSYILSIYEWGEKRGIDTVQADKKGKIVFSTNTSLPYGQYVIDGFTGEVGGKINRLLEFMVSPQNRKQVENSSFTIDSTGILQKRGSLENQIYTEFQNLLNTGWNQLNNAEELNTKIQEIITKTEKECSGSILEIMLKNTLFPAGSAQQILEKFPFGDSLILNTAFGKAKVKQYLQAIELNPNDTLIRLTDNLIKGNWVTNKGDEGRDGDMNKREGEGEGEGEGNGNANKETGIAKISAQLQALIACTAFDYFYKSAIMGQEGIAVHIAQEWFLNGKLEWPNKEGLFMLQMFVNTNKHSLIGMQAPNLKLVDTLGKIISLNSLEGDYTILYFYTDDCHTCKVETPKLVDFVNEYKGGILTIYAVYTQANIENWKTYINKEFVLYNPFVNWVNVYDPLFESGFHMLYNVLSTPQMFLLDKDKKIIGRNLKTDSLMELLQAKNKEADDLHKFFTDFFTKTGALDTTSIHTGIDAFYSKSAQKPELFREIFRELFNFLRLSSDYRLQEGAAYLGQKYILDKKELWSNGSFVEQVKRAIAVFNMNPLGGKAANLSLESINGSSIELYDIRNEYKVLYFYKINCGICGLVSKELQKLYDTYKNSKDINIEFIAINTGTDYKEWVKHVAQNGFTWQETWGGEDADEIYENYYLENVPGIYLLKDNIVIAKDVNDLDLKELLETIVKNKIKL